MKTKKCKSCDGTGCPECLGTGRNVRPLLGVLCTRLGVVPFDVLDFYSQSVRIQRDMMDLIKREIYEDG
jgi:hypothetical protein